MNRPPRRVLWIVGLVLAVLLGALALAYAVALKRLYDGVPEALGPRAQVERIELGWNGVTLYGLRVPAQAPWPAADELRAARVHLVADVRGLLADTRRIARADVDDAYVSVLRKAEGGFDVLPGLQQRRRERQAQGGAAARVRPTALGELHVRNATVDLYDGSIRRPPHQIRLAQVQARAEPLDVPDFDEPVQFSAEGVVQGPKQNGRFTVQGRAEPAAHSGRLQAKLVGVDLIVLQPYLLKLNEGGVKGGTLDMTVDATIDRNHLHAPGRLSLNHLELTTAPGVAGTFAGAPRQAVLAAMSRDGRIDVPFTLEGRLDDAKFSVNESFAAKAAFGLAEVLGVSIGGVAEGIGSVFKGLLGK